MQTTDETTQTYLVSDSGEKGPRMDVVQRMFERMLEYEEEVRTGKRIPQSLLPQPKGKRHGHKQTKTAQGG